MIRARGTRRKSWETQAKDAVDVQVTVQQEICKASARAVALTIAILAPAMTALGQTDRLPAGAEPIERIPENRRASLQSALEEAAAMARRESRTYTEPGEAEQRLERLLDSTDDRFDRITREPAERSADQFFVPEFVRRAGDEGAWIIYGLVAVPENGCLVWRKAMIAAVDDGTRWEVSGMIRELPMSHGPKAPCIEGARTTPTAREDNRPLKLAGRWTACGDPMVLGYYYLTPAGFEEAKVVRILDGRSIEARFRNGGVIVVRLAGVQVLGEAGEAQKRLSELLTGATIEILLYDHDFHALEASEIEARVILSKGGDVAMKLIEAGNARFSESRHLGHFEICEYRHAMADAKEARRGLWGQSPTTPK